MTRGFERISRATSLDNQTLSEVLAEGSILDTSIDVGTDSSFDIGDSTHWLQNVNIDNIDCETLDVFDSTHAEKGTITRNLTDFVIDSGIGSTTFYCRLAGTTAFRFDTIQTYFYLPIKPTTDGTHDIGSTSLWWGEAFIDVVDCETLDVFDSTHAEKGTITRSLTELIINTGTGSDDMLFQIQGATRFRVYTDGAGIGSDTKLYFEGTKDTYITYSTINTRLEFYVDGVLEGYIDTNGFVST